MSIKSLEKIQNISTIELSKIIDEPNVQIIDIRPIEAYNGWKLKNEVYIPTPQRLIDQINIRAMLCANKKAIARSDKKLKEIHSLLKNTLHRKEKILKTEQTFKHHSLHSNSD